MKDSQAGEFQFGCGHCQLCCQVSLSPDRLPPVCGVSVRGSGSRTVDLRRTSPNRTHSCVTHQWAAFSRRRRRNTGTQLITVPAAMGVPCPPPLPPVCPAHFQPDTGVRVAVVTGDGDGDVKIKQAATPHSRRRCHGSAQTPQ